MNKRRLALLLIVIFVFAGLMVFFVEGFMSGSMPLNFSSYKLYDIWKRNSGTLCDPCYDPSCKTVYPTSQQECNNPKHEIVPTGTPYLPRGRPVYSPTVDGVNPLTSGPAPAPGPASTPAPAPGPASTPAPAPGPASTPASTPAPAPASTPARSTMPSTMPLKATSDSTDPDTVTMSATDFYDYLRPQIIKTVTDSMNKTMGPSTSATPGLSTSSLPNVMPAALGTSKNTMKSPAAAQGEDYSSCKPFNKDEWIRKDSIPCYGCTL